jgi:hypothetical protein
VKKVIPALKSWIIVVVVVALGVLVTAGCNNNGGCPKDWPTCGDTPDQHSIDHGYDGEF